MKLSREDFDRVVIRNTNDVARRLGQLPLSPAEADRLFRQHLEVEPPATSIGTSADG